jgi:hypothetical protein
MQLYRGFNNYCRVSPESSLIMLYKATNAINPMPEQYKAWMDLVDTMIQNVVLEKNQFQEEIQNIVYKDKDNPDLIESYKIYLRRAYEGIRAAIGSQLLHYEILQRYKARCMWYDQQRLRKLAEVNEGNEEDALTRDLALYLFDNGISTLYRVRRGTHEYDLMGHRTENPIFVEVKAYKTSHNTRHNLTKGIAQLHAYLNSLEADNVFVEEGYYAIYRLGGPLYDLPWKISTNRRTFYPIIIDLGPSEVSGSRQPKPIQILLDEFFTAITKEGEGENKAE